MSEPYQQKAKSGSKGFKQRQRPADKPKLTIEQAEAIRRSQAAQIKPTLKTQKLEPSIPTPLATTQAIELNPQRANLQTYETPQATGGISPGLSREELINRANADRIRQIQEENRLFDEYKKLKIEQAKAGGADKPLFFNPNPEFGKSSKQQDPLGHKRITILPDGTRKEEYIYNVVKPKREAPVLQSGVVEVEKKPQVKGADRPTIVKSNPPKTNLKPKALDNTPTKATRPSVNKPKLNNAPKPPKASDVNKKTLKPTLGFNKL